RLVTPPRESHVAQPTLLVEPPRLPRRPREGEQAVLESGERHDGPLEPLRHVDGHERHALGGTRPLVRRRDQRGLSEIALDQRRPLPYPRVRRIIPGLIARFSRYLRPLRRTRHQLLDGLEPLDPLRPFVPDVLA